MIWAPWSAHTLTAFTGLEAARNDFASRGVKIDILAAADPGSRESDIRQQLADFHTTVPRLALSPTKLALTEARNQMPALLLFQDGALIDHRLGEQSFEQLRDWV